MTDGTHVRPATPDDLAAVGALAAKLVRMHHDTDPDRFFWVDDVETGYRRWLARELERSDAVVLVAEVGGSIVGYIYGTLEARDWNLLLDAHGAIHDVFVAESARRSGVGLLLVKALLAAFEDRGAERVVLSAMVGNEAAQRTFASVGFRPTMVEMTRSKPRS